MSPGSDPGGQAAKCRCQCAADTGETARDTEEQLLPDGRKSHAEASAGGQLSSTGLRTVTSTPSRPSPFITDIFIRFLFFNLAREKAEEWRFLLPGHSSYRICRGQNDAVSKAHVTGSTSCAPWTTPSEGRPAPPQPRLMMQQPSGSGGCARVLPTRPRGPLLVPTSRVLV